MGNLAFNSEPLEREKVTSIQILLVGTTTAGGCWFYNKGMAPKSLHELVGSYHDSVGKNAFWLLDWTPTQTGVLRPDHIARYAELGNFLGEA